MAMNAKMIDDNNRANFPEFTVGDTIKVHIKIKEGEKERVQVFQGIVIKQRNAAENSSFTVRKISFGVGVERIFPYECANIEKVEVIQKGKVRRAKLFYLRSLKGKALKIDEDTRERDAKREQSVSADATETQETSAEENTTSVKASTVEAPANS
ncbi:MAG: 50S ribosomal protein L19 [Bdellovibrionota bacterium]